MSSTGNTATSFTDTAAEPEVLYVYRVQASDVNGQWGEVSEPVPIRVPRSNSPATGAPVITGMAQVGQTLTMYIHDIADADGMENTAFRIKWLADGMVIQGIYDHVLLLVAAAEGKRIEVRVSFTDDAGNEENLTSAATDAVAARPNTPGHRASHHQRDGTGGRDDEGGHHGHRRRRRPYQRRVRPPVVGRRRGHSGRDQLHLYTGR